MFKHKIPDCKDWWSTGSCTTTSIPNKTPGGEGNSGSNLETAGGTGRVAQGAGGLGGQAKEVGGD